MSEGLDEEKETIGALLRRLIDDGRSLARAELAVFRTDFYRRMGRARSGVLLCLIGAIMGQAAAVTLLVTLSFVLTPWIGRIGGAAVSVALGVGLAVVLIRVGAGKLMLVVEDFDDGGRDGVPGINAVDELFDRMRQRSREARNRLAETVDETQARLHPQALIADLVDEIVDHAQTMMHNAVDAIRRRPAKATGAIITVLLLIIRPPIYRIVKGLGRATRRGMTSYRRKPADPPAPPENKETNS